jgi:hypothetical protein
MKNLLKWSTYLMVAALMFNIACSDDEPAPDNTPSPVGEWILTSATLVDGDITVTGENNLVVKNYTQDGMTFVDLDLPPGDVQTTSVLVGGALAGNVCENPANYGGFYMELTTDNKLIFYCPAEQTTNNQNTWTINAEADGSYTVSLNVVTSAGTVSVLVTDFQIAEDGSTMSGRAGNYPMVRDLSKDLGAPLDGGGINLQTIVVDLAFQAAQ